MKIFGKFLLIFLLIELQSYVFCDDKTDANVTIDKTALVDNDTGGVYFDTFSLKRRDKNSTFAYYVLGKQVKGDKLIRSDTIQEKQNPDLPTFETKVYGKIAVDLSESLRKKITRIEFEQMPEEKFKTGKAQNIEIVKGGVGSKAVSLRLTSQTGLGLSYGVRIYGI